MALPALPSDMIVFVDGSRPARFSRTGPRAGARSRLDTSGPTGQASFAFEPVYDRYNCGAGPAVLFGGSGAPSFIEPSYFDMPSFAMAIPFTLVCLARSDGAAVLAEGSANVGASVGVRLASSTAPTIAIRGPGGLQTADATAGAAWDTDNTARALVLTYDGTAGGAVLTANRVGVPLSFGGVASGAGAIPTIGRIGADHAGANALTGGMAFFGIVPGRVVSAPEAASIAAYLAQFWYAPPPGAVTRNTI